jgi:AbrB family looped-hinge helix DNA binding protein
MKSILSATGQITIPKEFRDQLGLKPGASVKLFVDASGHIVILPLRPITALKGILNSPRGPVSLEEIEEGIAEGATERYREFLNQ